MKDQDPPRLPDRFLRWFCSEEVLETLQGDLYELYHKRLAKSGKLMANLLFAFDIISACRPFAFSKRL
jgi:putative ABC transport system permease protein